MSLLVDVLMALIALFVIDYGDRAVLRHRPEHARLSGDRVLDLSADSARRLSTLFFIIESLFFGPQRKRRSS